MTKISAIVLTLNEEKNIRACLESLQWCDEIIVVDSHSDDNTVEIAKEYTGKIYQKEANGGFDQLRSIGAEHASGDWLLRVDADELVPKTLSKRLREIAKENKVDVVKAPRKNYIFGSWMQHCSWWPDHQVFMFKPESVDIGDQLHEWITVRDEADILKLPANEDNAFEHFSRLGTKDFLEHMNTYTSIEAEQQEGASLLDIFIEPVKGFGKSYVLHRGYRAGLKGLLLSLLESIYRATTVMKMLERERIGTEEKFQERYNEHKNRILSAYES